jgi:chromosome segregation ATPase
MQKQKQLVGFFMVFFLVLGLAPSLFSSFFSQGSALSLVGFAQAKDGEDDDNDEDEDESEDEDEDEDDDNDEDEDDDAEKIAKKQAKEKADRDRKILKNKTDSLRNSSDRVDKEDDDSDDDREKLLERAADELDDAQEEIIRAEERIAKAAAEGVNVSLAQARLAKAKDRVKALEALIATGVYSRDELRVISREVKKLARFASHKDVHSARDMQKDLAKVAKRIAQTEGKIALLASVGGAGTSFTETLNSYKQELESLRNVINQGGDAAIGALPALESLERKIKVLKSSVENAIYALGGTDEEYDDNYESEIEDWSEDLEDVAEIEGGEVGAVIKMLIAEQKMSGTEVGTALQSVDQRNVVLQTLFGAKLKDIEKLNAEIAANKTRIEKLKVAAATIADPEVQAILNEQIAELESETEKLKMFVSGQENRLSVFGWFFKLF